MTKADYIAIGAVIISIISFLYTLISNANNSKKELIKERKNFLKLIAKLIRSIKYQNTEIEKTNILDEVREELNYNTCYEDNDKFIIFNEDIDDSVYSLIRSECPNDFDILKDEILEKINNFK